MGDVPHAEAIERGSASAPTLARVRAIAERVAASLGLEVFDVQVRRESIGLVTRVIIDRAAYVPAADAPPDAPRPLPGDPQEPIGVADCQRVSQEMSAILDVEDPIEGKYTLEVSSPGLDRPLRGPEDYRRFEGRLARVMVTTPIDGQKHFKGRLQGVEADTVLLADERGAVQRIPLAAIGRARLEVEF